MRLGLFLGYWTAEPADHTNTVARAEAAGLDSVWTAEAYGSDAYVPLAHALHARSRIRVGTAVTQLFARTPAATGMAAITMDHLSEGRFVLGLGVSGPQVVEGWYGVPFTKPLARTREYVDILRMILRREEPVTAPGPHYPIPATVDGLGKPLKSTVHPYRADIPILIGAEGPKNIALAAEIADGWIGFLLSPADDVRYRHLLQDGFNARGGRPDSFEVATLTFIAVDDDVERAANRIRPHLALYIGGMGTPGENFHRNMIDRLGYANVTGKVARRWEAGDREGAAEAIPLDLLDQVALLGPVDRIAARLPAWDSTCIDTLIAYADIVDVELISHLFDSSPP